MLFALPAVHLYYPAGSFSYAGCWIIIMHGTIVVLVVRRFCMWVCYHEHNDLDDANPHFLLKSEAPAQCSRDTTAAIAAAVRPQNISHRLIYIHRNASGPSCYLVPSPGFQVTHIYKEHLVYIRICMFQKQVRENVQD